MCGASTIKQLRERASDTIFSILQRGATAEEGTAGVSWEGPGLLLGYTRCLGPAVWEGGLPPGHGEQQDRSPSEGPVSSQGEMGRQWMDRCIWPGRGVQVGNVTGIITGRKRKGQVGDSQTHAGDGGLLEATQSQMDWRSEAQLHSLVPL